MASATVNPYARTPNAASVTLYWRVSGIALAALAGIGILLVAIDQAALLGGFLTFDTAHNLVHALLAGVAIALGFGSAPAALRRNLAKAVGVVYLLLAVVGFVSASTFGLGALLGLHLELGENLVHLLLGAWGAYAGFSD